MARKSVIKKSICRNINTARFEQLEVKVEYQEEIEWENLKERQQKSDDWTKVILKDFDETLARVCRTLNLEHKTAVLYDPRDDKDYRPEAGKPNELAMCSSDSLDGLDQI